mgnify:CR=1 FL=1
MKKSLAALCAARDTVLAVAMSKLPAGSIVHVRNETGASTEGTVVGAEVKLRGVGSDDPFVVFKVRVKTQTGCVKVVEAAYEQIRLDGHGLTDKVVNPSSAEKAKYIRDVITPEIVKLRDQGLTYQAIANRLGVSQSWAHNLFREIDRRREPDTNMQGYVEIGITEYNLLGGTKNPNLARRRNGMLSTYYKKKEPND